MKLFNDVDNPAINKSVLNDYDNMILSDLRRRKKVVALEYTLFPARQITPYGKLMYAAILFKMHADSKPYCLEIGKLVVYFNVYPLIPDNLNDLAGVLKSRRAIKDFFAVVLTALPDNDKHKANIASLWEQIRV